MAVYTTEIETICKHQWLVNQGWDAWESIPSYPPIDDIIADVGMDVMPTVVLQSDAPFTKQSVIAAILKHYWKREIGMETVGLWKYGICTRLNEILPKYVEIAKAQVSMGSIWQTENKQFVHSGEYGRRTTETGNNTKLTNGTSGNVRDTTANERGEYGKLMNRTLGELTHSTESSSEDNSKVQTKSVDMSDEQVNKDTKSFTTDTTGNHDTTYGKSTNKDQIQTNNLKDTSTQNNTTNTQDSNSFSDTPQNGVNNVKNGNYLTEFRYVDNDVIGNSNQTVDKTGTVEITDSENNSGQDKLAISDKVVDSGTLEMVRNKIVNEDTSDSVKQTVGKTGENDISVNTTDKVNDGGTDSKLSTGNVTDNGTSSLNENGSFLKNGSDTGNDSYNDTWTGYQGNKPKTLWDMNQYYLNIYQMIIGEVAGFFMGILG